MTIAYDDPFVRALGDDIAELIAAAVPRPDLQATIRGRLDELGRQNCPAVGRYHERTQPDLGLPHTAWKGETGEPLTFFPGRPPARVFRSSGTTGAARTVAAYSPLGLELMRCAILAGARRHIIGARYRPAIVRLVPSEAEAPEVIMAHGMERIADTFGDPQAGGSVVSGGRLDVDRALGLFEAARAADQPVVLLGGSFAFVHLLDALRARGVSLRLPRDSRAVDAGGFKGRSRVVDVDELRAGLGEVLGLASAAATNLFGMTELASQLYDARDVPVGPRGERPKGSEPYAAARVRDPATLAPLAEGLGLLEITDLTVIDRPHTILTGDLGVASSHGVAIVGRAQPGDVRGCALSLEAVHA